MKKSHSYLFWILISIFIISRIIILLTYQFNGSGEEGVIGLMGKHIITEGETPVFFYGQYYNGGGALEAYMSVIFFSLLGYNFFALKLVGLTLSVFLFIISYRFIKKYFSSNAAIIFCILLTFGSYKLLFWTTQIQGGYIESIIIFFLMLHLFFDIIFENKNSNFKIIILAALYNLGIWLHDLLVPVLIPLLFIWIIDKRKKSLKQLYLFFSSLILFYIPLLLFNINNCFQNMYHYFHGKKIGLLISELIHNMNNNCPIINSTIQNRSLTDKFLSIGKTFLDFFGDSLAQNFYSIFIFLFFIVILFMNKDKILFLIKKKPIILHEKKTAYMVLFICLYLSIFLILILDRIRERYWLLPYILILSLVSIQFAYVKYNSKSVKFHKILTICGLIFILIFGSVEFIYIINKENAGLSKIATILKENNITEAYSNYYLKWGLIFQSNEEIIVSCDFFGECDYRYPIYEKRVNKSDNVAFIMVENSTIEKKFLNYTHNKNIRYKKYSIDIDLFNVQPQTVYLNIRRINIYIGLDQSIKPIDFTNSKAWDDSFI